MKTNEAPGTIEKRACEAGSPDEIALDADGIGIRRGVRADGALVDEIAKQERHGENARGSPFSETVDAVAMRRGGSFYARCVPVSFADGPESGIVDGESRRKVLTDEPRGG